QTGQATGEGVSAVAEVRAVVLARVVVAVEEREPIGARPTPVFLEEGSDGLDADAEVVVEGVGVGGTLQEGHGSAAAVQVTPEALRPLLVTEADAAEQRHAVDARPHFVDVDYAVAVGVAAGAVVVDGVGRIGALVLLQRDDDVPLREVPGAAVE